MRRRLFTAARVAAAIALILVFSSSAIAATKKKGKRALVTFYWVADESLSKYKGKASVTLRDMAGREIAKTTRKFKRDLVMQGSGWLRDGRTLIYVTKVRGEIRFRITSEKYGQGSTGCPLIPYRTIAVDPHFIKVGSTVFIPQYKGAKLPDGTIHDGNFIASDRGTFKGAHIDFFVGAGPRGARPFIRKGYGSRSHVTANVTGKSSNCEP